MMVWMQISSLTHCILKEIKYLGNFVDLMNAKCTQWILATNVLLHDWWWVFVQLALHAVCLDSANRDLHPKNAG